MKSPRNEIAEKLLSWLDRDRSPIHKKLIDNVGIDIVKAAISVTMAGENMNNPIVLSAAIMTAIQKLLEDGKILLKKVDK